MTNLSVQKVDCDRNDSQSATLQERFSGLSVKTDADSGPNQDTRLSPVWKLPAELLSLIFIQCLPDEKDAWIRRPNKRYAPLLPASVCRHWRDLTLSTPLLWRSLRFESYDVAASAEFIHTYLGRSDSVPLHLRTSFGGDSVYSVKLFRSLWEHLDRCEQLAIAFSGVRLRGLLPNACAPRLKSLSTSRLSSDYYVGEPIDLDLSFAPCLEELHMLGASFKRLRQDTVPWARLTFLTIQRPGVESMQMALKLLKQCFALEACFLCIERASAIDLAEHGQLHLDCLQRLGLAFMCTDGTGSIDQLVECLCVPKLAVLTVEAERTGPAEVWLSMIKRSKASIRHLAIRSGEAAFESCDGLSAVLAEMPDLETLAIRGTLVQGEDPFSAGIHGFHGGDSLRALTRPPFDAGVAAPDRFKCLPKLTTLHVLPGCCFDRKLFEVLIFESVLRAWLSNQSRDSFKSSRRQAVVIFQDHKDEYVRKVWSVSDSGEVQTTETLLEGFPSADTYLCEYLGLRTG